MLTPDPIDDRLGPLRSTHPVQVHRYRNTGGIALAIALGGAILLSLMLAHPIFIYEDYFGFDWIFASVLTTLILPLPIAVGQLTRKLQSGKEETFLLYDHGLARHTPKGAQSWTWEEIWLLRVNSTSTMDEEPLAISQRLSRLLGQEYRCLVRFTDGAKISIDGHTTNGQMIVQALLTYRPDVLVRYRSAAFRRTMVATLPICGLVLASGIVRSYLFLNNTETSTDYHPAQERFFLLVATGMIGCFLGMMLCFTQTVLIGRTLTRDHDPHEQEDDSRFWRYRSPRP
ncbi:hypothetical protein [Nocardiopsis listeri]|uniref:hypothetical protein n=1 Tax=Nocardiopsis listeri TaxID=53440 RepID=UPI00083255F8|nr:hypothetical protein [Nocardiopsis listeri]